MFGMDAGSIVADAGNPAEHRSAKGGLGAGFQAFEGMCCGLGHRCYSVVVE